MAIYFASSDESGSFRKKMSKSYIRSHPYYVRATVITLASDWKKLRSELNSLRQQFRIPNNVEVKWSHIWSIWKHNKNQEKIPSKKPYCILGNICSYEDLLDFANKVFGFLANLDFVKIIISVSDNSLPINIPEVWHLERHLQEHMQRIEMELQASQDNLAVLFFDPISKEKDKALRNAYFQIFQSGDFIQKYSHIKDSLNMEYSHHSAGIQLADFIAGCFAGMLRGFRKSAELFHGNVKPYLRKSPSGQVLGYGIREVPRDDTFRLFLRGKLEESP